MAAVVALPLPSTTFSPGPAPAARPEVTVVPESRRTSRVVTVALAAVALACAIGLATLAPVDGSVAPPPAEEHVAVAGETMWSIARQYAPAGEAAGFVEELVAFNGTAAVRPGQTVLIP